MSDEELKIVAISALKSLISSQRVSTPTTSLDLLTHVMTTKLPDGLLPRSPPPKFRLSDIPLFERILVDLSTTWEEGLITLSRENASGDGTMTIYELGIHGQGHPRTSLFGSNAGRHSSMAINEGSKKRKRVVDEDADSAAGADEEDEALAEDDEDNLAVSPSLASLSPEMREVYALIQKDTAKGKLLAERVSVFYLC